MSKITNNGLTRSGTWCSIAVPTWQHGRQRVNRVWRVMPISISTRHPHKLTETWQQEWTNELLDWRRLRRWWTPGSRTRKRLTVADTHISSAYRSHVSTVAHHSPEDTSCRRRTYSRPASVAPETAHNTLKRHQLYANSNLSSVNAPL